MSSSRKIPCAYGTITVYPQRGKIRYRLRATIDGKRESLGLFDTIEEAQAQAKAYAEQLGNSPTGLTLGAWGKRWLDERERAGTHRTVRDTRGLWDRYIFPSNLASMGLRNVKAQHVDRWISEIAQRRSPRGRRKGQRLAQQTVRNVLNALSAGFADAVRAGKAARNPCHGIRVAKVPSTDEAWTHLTAEEIHIIRDADLPLKQHTAFTLAIYSGLRAGEIWGLRWEDVNFKDDELVVRGSYKGPTKGGRVRRIPMLPPVKHVLELWRRRDGLTRAAGLVFHARDGSIHTNGYDAGWRKRWRKECGIRTAVRFHDFRHTCASHLIAGTWGRAWRLEEVQAVLGHASRTTTERYAHLAPDSIRGAFAKAISEWRE